MAGGGVSLSVSSADLGSVGKRIAKIASATAHARPLMNAIGAALESSTRKRFRTQQSPEGATWRPSIRARLKGGTTLIAHGHLRDSITHDADGNHAEVGSNLIYAAIHQLGGVIRAKGGGMLRFRIPGVGWRQVAQVTIPARPYLGVSEEDREEMGAQAERYLEKAAA
ncbi:MAG: phage virion morphogenesis protein [Caulobacteraceae bacterium]